MRARKFCIEARDPWPKHTLQLANLRTGNVSEIALSGFEIEGTGFQPREAVEFVEARKNSCAIACNGSCQCPILVRCRAEDLLLDHFGITLHGIDRRAQFVKQLAQTIRSTLGAVVYRRNGPAEATDIAVEASFSPRETWCRIDDPLAFDSFRTAQGYR